MTTRTVRSEETTCRCAAYRFPHRMSGGACKRNHYTGGPVTAREAEAAEDDHGECHTCGGSGGGEGYWRCQSCSGSGCRPGWRLDGRGGAHYSPRYGGGDY